jgi:SAM-dependent methyltransferase
MFNSKKYWNDRYLKGGDSGRGSYGELSQFKADVINDFVEKNEIKSIVDYGVGDCNQLKLFNTENLIYTGIDVSEFIIYKCKENFKDDKKKNFIHVDNIDNELKGELVLSCDVIYHLIEERVYKEYMDKLFSMSNKYVIIYAKNEDVNHAQHVKFRKFSNYIDSNLPEWQLIKHIPNKFPQLKLGQNNDNTSPSDFYIYKKNIKNRESELLGEPANILRLPYITKMLDSLHLKEGTRVLDFGGNQFSEYCKENNYIYNILDLEKPQKNGTGGYYGGGLTYDGRNIPIGKNSFDVIIISFVLHHTSSNCIHLLKQLKNITTNYLIICEDLCGIDYPIKWHQRCFNHQNEGIFRSDEEWKFLFESLGLHLIDTLNIRCQRDKEFSDPYKHIYRIQYILRK